MEKRGIFRSNLTPPTHDHQPHFHGGFSCSRLVTARKVLMVSYPWDVARLENGLVLEKSLGATTLDSDQSPQTLLVTPWARTTPKNTPSWG